MNKILYYIFVMYLLTSSLSSYAQRETEDIATLIRLSKENLQSNPKRASYYAARATTLFTEEKPNTEHAQAILLYSQAEQMLGNFDLSLKNLYDAMRYIDPTDKVMTAELYSLMGRCYRKFGDYNKAMELNDKATSIYKAMGDSTSIAMCYNERGITHCYLNEYTVADKLFKRALSINRAQNNLKEIAMNLNNICLYEGNTDDKLSAIQEAISINKSLNAYWSLGENYNNMGKQYYYAKQYRKALAALQTAYEYANSIGARELICDYNEYSSMVYAAIGDYQKAYGYMNNMYELSKELQSNNKLRNIEQEISYKNLQDQKHDTEITEQNYKIELLKRNTWLLSFALVLIIAISIFLYKWYKHRKNMQLVETRFQLQHAELEVTELKLRQQELELQNAQVALNDSRQEVTSFAVFLRSRNELLDKIHSMVREAYKMDYQSIIPHLKKINAFIKQHQQGDNINGNILMNIENKSNEFLKRLTELHPRLTQGEKYLATLLRVNLSTKEISMLTGTTPKTINMSRYRLRKSLNLSPDDDLVTYLQSI
jgi:tetratricopeptide (TPR) repeat protein